MLTVKQKVELFESCFGNTRFDTTGKNITVKCPVCEFKGKITKKKKLSINIESGVYHCWVCESKGKNVGILALKYAIQKNPAIKLRACFSTLESKEEAGNCDFIQALTLPEDFVLLSEVINKNIYKKHVNYLLTRGFNKEKIQKFRVGASEDYKLRNRVIFPSFDKNQNLNYYIGRSIDPNEKRRYKNCSHPRKSLIFKEFDLSFNKELILTEGIFDLVQCPDNATCVLGSWIDESYLLFQEIVKNKTPVILCFDPDAGKKMIKIAKKLYEYCVSVKISNHKDKDFGDMTKNEVDKCLREAKPYDNVERVGYLINELRSGSLF